MALNPLDEANKIFAIARKAATPALEPQRLAMQKSAHALDQIKTRQDFETAQATAKWRQDDLASRERNQGLNRILEYDKMLQELEVQKRNLRDREAQRGSAEYIAHLKDAAARRRLAFDEKSLDIQTDQEIIEMMDAEEQREVAWLNADLRNKERQLRANILAERQRVADFEMGNTKNKAGLYRHELVGLNARTQAEQSRIGAHKALSPEDNFQDFVGRNAFRSDEDLSRVAPSLGYKDAQELRRAGLSPMHRSQHKPAQKPKTEKALSPGRPPGAGAPASGGGFWDGLWGKITGLAGSGARTTK